MKQPLIRFLMVAALAAPAWASEDNTTEERDPALQPQPTADVATTAPVVERPALTQAPATPVSVQVTDLRIYPSF
jgi:hypothetical protein